MSSDPAHILQIGMGFMASKTLLSAIELNLFSVLARGPMTAAQIGDRLALHPRSLRDFLDALVSLQLLDRSGDGENQAYSNAGDAAVFLDKASPAYLGGILEMSNARLYGFWGNLTEALRTGQPQSEVKHGRAGFFEAVYADESRLEQFLGAMAGIQLGAQKALAAKVDFKAAKTLCDVGGANGSLSITVAKAHPHLSCMSFDLPVVAPVARRHVEAMDAAGRVKILSGDFFKDPLPTADVIVMGNVLHDWDESQKQMLVQKAFDALPAGGRFIAIENIIDDERRKNTFGLLMSLNMLIEVPGGFDYTGVQFDAWAKAAGFTHSEVIPLAGPTSAAIAYKP
jgi:precorrin-6B methylase 2